MIEEEIVKRKESIVWFDSELNIRDFFKVEIEEKIKRNSELWVWLKRREMYWV